MATQGDNARWAHDLGIRFLPFELRRRESTLVSRHNHVAGERSSLSQSVQAPWRGGLSCREVDPMFGRVHAAVVLAARAPSSGRVATGVLLCCSAVVVAPSPSDAAAPTPGSGIAIADSSVFEGDADTTAARFVITRGGLRGRALTVEWRTAEGTAAAPGDYATASGVVTLTKKRPTATVEVRVVGDLVPEADEAFAVVLSNPSRGSIMDASGLGTIFNDDEPAANLLDVATAGVDDGLGYWAAWFSCDVSSSDVAHAGPHSMRVDVSQAFGWGVLANNSPGFEATPGPKTISFWARAGSANPAGNAISMRVHWRNGDTDLQVDDATLPSTSSTAWGQGSATVNAPPGTTHAYVEILGSGSASSAGDIYFLDDFSLS